MKLSIGDFLFPFLFLPSSEWTFSSGNHCHSLLRDYIIWNFPLLANSPIWVFFALFLSLKKRPSLLCFLIFLIGIFPIPKSFLFWWIHKKIVAEFSDIKGKFASITLHLLPQNFLLRASEFLAPPFLLCIKATLLFDYGWHATQSNSIDVLGRGGTAHTSRQSKIQSLRLEWNQFAWSVAKSRLSIYGAYDWVHANSVESVRQGSWDCVTTWPLSVCVPARRWSPNCAGW